MLTLAEALQLPIFETTELVAGAGGLNRPIAWVHNVGVPDAANWLNGGELALTTANNMPTEPEEQAAYLLALIEKNVAALGVAVGRMIDHLSPTLLEIADAHDFPLLEIPFHVRFVDIARAANERILQENMAMVTRALHIQQTLTRLVLEGGGIKQLAAVMAQLINQSISIETERFEALASVNIAPVDEARRYTQQYGRTDPRLVRALEDVVLPEIRRTLRPVFIPQMPHVGLEMERVLAPIVVHGEIYGYVWIIADDGPITDLDRMAIESGATIAALMMLYQESIQNAEASLKGSLLTRLVQGEAGREDLLTDQALRYGLDIRQPFRVLLVDWPESGPRRLVGLSQRVNRLIAERSYTAIAGQFAGQLLIVGQDTSPPLTERHSSAHLPLSEPERVGGEVINALADGIHTESAHFEGSGGLCVGISAAQRGAESVAAAYVQCREALLIARRLRKAENTIYFDDLGYLHALYHAGPSALTGNPLVPGLRLLQEEQQADLFNTLEAYLDVGGNGVATAELLHIHRSTLNYRLARIEDICAVDLSQPSARLNLQIALKLLRLFGNE